ncbi:MAG: hypothetical protein FWH03_07120 [Firmicutes bacterium]|nr:hypothetical protein [Bacillota bacterium]
MKKKKKPVKFKFKKWETSSKPSFWQQNHQLRIFFLFGIVFCFAVTLSMWVMAALGLTVAKGTYSLAVALSLVSLTLLFGCLRFFFLRVIVDLQAQTITVRGFFGVVTQCKISEIEKIYVQGMNMLEARAQLAIGGWIIIEDTARTIKDPKNFYKKGCYVKFIYTDKTEKIVKKFWKHPIKTDGEIF